MTLKLLVVDEHSEYFELVNESAELCRHQFHVKCRHAASVDETKSAIGHWQPSVVLVDLNLGDSEGFSVIELCAQGQIPVIAMSDSKNSEIEDVLRDRGATGWVLKSSDPEDIEQLLAQLSAETPSPTEIH
ncbi:MAG: response regulator [Oligoflexia bacterium]|nr:response regulator [Oligoflexia bacterium]